MASLHPSDQLESDSVTSSPRSEHHHDLHLTRVRFMCSFGGNILPRPHDNQLRYVGGDTRIIAVHRSSTFSTLITRLSKLAGSSNISIKYQLPNEDLDALISVTTDEDVENMMEEYDRLAQTQNSRSARLRLFLFTKSEDSRASSISSLLDGSTNRENWFLDAINNAAGPGSGLERGRSEASSIVSEVPDYLFGFENSEDPQLIREVKPKSRFIQHDNMSAVSDPGSPAPAVSSPFCSTSSSHTVPPMPDLPPVKTKPDNPTTQVVEPKQSGQIQIDGFSGTVEQQSVQQQTGYSGQPTWHYVQDTRYPSPPVVEQMPVYYVPGPVQPGSAPVQHPVPMRPPYVPQYQVPSVGQIPVGYHQAIPGSGRMYGGAVRPVTRMDHPYDQSVRIVSADGVNQQVYYGVTKGGLVPAGYPGMVIQGGEELRRSRSDSNPGQIS